MVRTDLPHESDNGTSMSQGGTEPDAPKPAFVSDSLFLQAPVAILVCEETGLIGEANQAACRLLGNDKKDLIGLNVSAIASGVEGLTAVLRREDVTQPGAPGIACLISRSDGSSLAVEVRVSLVDAAGESRLRALYLFPARGGTEPANEPREWSSDYWRFIELSPNSIFLCRHGIVEFANTAAIRLLDIADQAPVVGRPFATMLHPDYRAMADDDFEGLLGEDSPVPIKFLRPDGAALDAMLFAGKALDDANQVIVIIRDITEMMNATRHVAAQVRRLNSILDTAHEAIVVMDRTGRIETFNRSAEKMFACASIDAVGQDFGAMMARNDANGFHALLMTRGKDQTKREADGALAFTAVRLDGSEFPAEYSLSAFNLDDRRLFTAVIRDVTERRLFEDHLAHSAMHDALTGLPNRRFVEEELERALKTASAQDGQVSVWFIDLDGFTTVNDVMGHAAGDELLIAASKRLADLSGPQRCVARFSGDEFIVVSPGRLSCHELKNSVGQLMEHMVRPFSIRGRDISVSANVGIALFPDHALNASDLVTHASAAMIDAKSGGRNRFRLFDPAMHARSVERLALENDLRHSIGRQDFILHYQPQIDLGTGRMTGMEALIRWHHPTLGMVPPGRFIHLAEQTGLILPIGEWVLRQACTDLQNLASTTPDVSIAVNISARQFSGGDIRGLIRRTLDETGANPERLEIEITESTLMSDPDRVSALLKDLKTLGIKVAVDDFGTGYSSLGYLKRFPVDTLKMDQSFVRDIAENPQDEAIAMTIVTLAHAMGMSAVGEGVETIAQHRFLKKLNCDIAQGYYYSRPQPLSELSRFLAPPAMV